MSDMGPRTEYARGKSEWFFNADEERILYLALDHAIADSYLTDEQFKIINPIFKELEPNEP